MKKQFLLAAGATDPGKRRPTNEDAYLCEPDEGIFAVIDGMGGHAAGEVAAAEAGDVIGRRLKHPTGSPEVRLREALTAANNVIWQRSSENSAFEGMGCVVTTLVIEEQRLFAAHVGDTRLYRIRDNVIEKLTRDHSPVGMQEDDKKLSEFEAMQHPQRHVVLRSLGSELHEPDDEDFIDFIEEPFKSDCCLLLCTDGLSDLVPSGEIRRLVTAYAGDPAKAVTALIDAAIDSGGTDNVTVVVVAGPDVDRTAPGLPSRGAPAARQSGERKI